jgi:hypothetical protein
MLQILKRVTQIDNFEIGSHPKKYPLNDAYIYAFLIVSSHMYIYKLCHNADDGRLFLFTCLQRCDLGVNGDGPAKLEVAGRGELTAGVSNPC